MRGGADGVISRALGLPCRSPRKLLQGASANVCPRRGGRATSALRFGILFQAWPLPGQTAGPSVCVVLSQTVSLGSLGLTQICKCPASASPVLGGIAVCATMPSNHCGLHRHSLFLRQLLRGTAEAEPHDTIYCLGNQDVLKF